jgi:hypothetical protein
VLNVFGRRLWADPGVYKGVGWWGDTHLRMSGKDFNEGMPTAAERRVQEAAREMDKLKKEEATRQAQAAERDQRAQKRDQSRSSDESQGSSRLSSFSDITLMTISESSFEMMPGGNTFDPEYDVDEQSFALSATPRNERGERRALVLSPENETHVLEISRL